MSWPVTRTGSLFRATFLAILTAALLLAPAVTVFSADVPIATVPVGDAPVAVGVNPMSHRVYVANYYGDSVSIIDGTSDTVTATVEMGDWTIPLAVIANPLATPARAYVANFWDNSVTVIDESTNAETATVPSNGVHGGGPRALALNPSGPTPKLYVADYGSGFVTVLNALTYEEITHVYCGDSPRALGIFASAGRTRIYVANRGSWTLSIIDGDTDTIIKTLPLDALPKAIAVDTTTGYAYVTNEGANSVTVVDDSDNIAATIETGARPVGIAVDEANGRLLVANYDDGTVSVFGTSDFAQEATVAVGTNPWAIAFDSGDEKAFVTNYGSNSTSVIDNTLAVTNVACGTNPYALAVDEGQSPHKTYVGNWNSDDVTVIDEPVAQQSISLFDLGVSEADAADDPVSVVIDEVDTSGEGVIARGAATSARPVYPAAISAVFWRISPLQAWNRAQITLGEGTPDVSWEADLGSLAEGTHELEVVALDQTSAAASVSDGGTAVRTSAPAGGAAASFDVGEAEPHQTTTTLELTKAQGASSQLTAYVECAEDGCAGPGGEVVFEKLAGSNWDLIGTAVLVEGAGSIQISRSSRGEYRARYVGDAEHAESLSQALVIAPGSSGHRALIR